MRQLNNILWCRPYRFIIIIFGVISIAFSANALAGKIEITLPAGNRHIIQTHVFNIAVGSDTLLCDGHIVSPDEYQLNRLSGQIVLADTLPCDSIIFIAFQLPSWLLQSVGNETPKGKRFITIRSDSSFFVRRNEYAFQEVRLSGNKSFSFAVGRTGEGYFSQGLRVEVDARLAENVRLRGAISDKGSSQNSIASPTNFGTTTTISELDKYFFELSGRRFIVQAGDITTAQNRYLAKKRFQGVHASYHDSSYRLTADVGHPAGRYMRYSFMGTDGKQGPYQIRGNDGLPTAIIPGSEKVFLDGQLIEGGTNREYAIDYGSGRITFSPRQLITDRSRVEIDFEATSGGYEQDIYDAEQELTLFNNRLSCSMGIRRETDSKSRLRFLSLSPTDMDILAQAGDSATLAMRETAVADTNGAYVLRTDSSGHDYYFHVGKGNGDYSVSFSYVGEARGDYHYLGDGVYQFAGIGLGEYLPILFLPLPSRNDYFYASVRGSLYKEGNLTVTYRGNDKDKNLFSARDDADNLRSLLEAEFTHSSRIYESDSRLRFRQRNYSSLRRLNQADDARLFALPGDTISGDELRLMTRHQLSLPGYQVNSRYGQVSYKDNLMAHKFEIDGVLLKEWLITPSVMYQSGNSHSSQDTSRKGIYEKQQGKVIAGLYKTLRMETEYEKEFTKNTYEVLPSVEQYTLYTGRLFYRHSVVSMSRREEFYSTDWGRKGPQLDKIQLTSDEEIGRLRVSVTGTWLNQKALDSDRANHTERLFETSFRYLATGGWLAIQAGYRQNLQVGSAIGYRYLFVGSGRGDFRYENGQYFPAVDGDYIQVKEARGALETVSIGEKNHNIIIYPGRMMLRSSLRKVLLQIAIRLKSEVVEEALGSGRRTLKWLLPWQSSSHVSYNNRKIRESYQLLLFPSFNFYSVGFSYKNRFEEQDAGAILFRNMKEYRCELKRNLLPTIRGVLELTQVRNREFGIGLRSLHLVTNEYAVAVVLNNQKWRVMPKLAVSVFTDDKSGGEGQGLVISNALVYHSLKNGEIRMTMEFSSLTEQTQFTQSEFVVTSGRRFGKSGKIALSANYNIAKSLRLNINMTDRLYENRSAEFVGRGELIASF